MTREKFLPVRGFLVLLAGLLLAACGGGGGNAGDGMNNSGPVAGDCEGSGSGSVTISGHAEYEFVPAVETSTGAKLDYAASEFRPIRAAEVQAVCAGSSEVFASTVTDDAGAFRLVVPGDVDVEIRVRAAMTSPAWDVRVVDNTRDQATWSAQGESIDSGTENFGVTLHVPSGWDGSEYSATRAAAPFAILDSVYIAMQKVLEADPDAEFPALKLNWSPENSDTNEQGRPCNSTVKDFPFEDGCIGTSFYANYGSSAGRNIFILGDAGNDTDEYDNHVIIHEWGHYYEDTFSRSDSIGGAHGGDDVLDPRVAFGEGWGNAFSAIATDDPVYVDTLESRQAHGFIINVEDDTQGHVPEGSHPGWWNESSVQEIIYDLYDDTSNDPAALDFGPIHDVLTGGQRTTEALATLFSFIAGLREENSAEITNIDSVVAEHHIAPIDSIWGEGRTTQDNGSEFNALLGSGAEDFVIPVYTLLDSIADATSRRICTTNALAESESEVNRLGVRRFLRFTGSSGTWTVTVEGGSDPDFYIRRQGDLVAFGEETGATETQSVELLSGATYVLEVLDYINANDVGDGGESCLDITFERT